MSAATRDLAWDGCVNVRDLGGHPTDGGGETQFGAVVRADSVRGLSDAGWEALVGYGVSRIVDLRWHEELAEDPPAALPVEVVHVPLLGTRAETDPITAVVGRIADAASWKQATYVEFLSRFAPNFARAVTAVAEAPDGGVVVHCAGGVDRTGLLVALLLRLAGVPRDDVAADYATSERNWAPYTDSWIAQAGDDDERERRRLLAPCRPETMLGVLDELERRYGGERDYLLGAGASERVLARVRERLRA